MNTTVYEIEMIKSKHGVMIPKSEIIHSQEQHLEFRNLIDENGDKVLMLEVDIRYDDECKNGHNSFSITGSIHHKRINRNNPDGGCGSIHETIAHCVPELKKYIKWHLCSSDEPMHYLANTKYHAMGGDLKAAQSCAIWEGGTRTELTSDYVLIERLPSLMMDFRSAMLELDFKY